MQLDLFGEVERVEAEVVAAAAARETWTARFERAPWVAPYDTAGGMKKGDSVLGWRCPDPECGQVEINAYTLRINHGWDPGIPGEEPYAGRCYQVRRRAADAERCVNCAAKLTPEDVDVCPACLAKLCDICDAVLKPGESEVCAECVAVAEAAAHECRS